MKNIQVLIVEEELIIAEYLLVSLRDKGYEVVGTPRSIDDAISGFAGTHPDLIILDTQLKGQAEMIQAALTVRMEFHMDIPIVFLTPFPVRGLQTGKHDSYVTKPFSEKELYAAIGNALKHRGGV